MNTKKRYRKRSPKASPVGIFRRMALRRQGRIDGRSAIQIGPDDACISPYVQELVRATRKRAFEEIQQMRNDMEDHFIEENALRRSMTTNDAQQSEYLDVLRNMEAATDFHLVKAGEEALNPQIRIQRRRRELEGRQAAVSKALFQLKENYTTMKNRLDQLIPQIREREIKTRLELERIRAYGEGCLTIYYRSLIKSHPQGDQLPGTIRLPWTRGDELIEEFVSSS